MTTPDTPPLTDLIGLDPNFTGGLSPEEYLRRQRCGECDEALRECDAAREQAKQAQAVVAAARAAVANLVEQHPHIRDAQPGWFHDSTLRLVAAVDALEPLPVATPDPAPHCGLCGSEACPAKPGEGCTPGPFETVECPGTDHPGQTCDEFDALLDTIDPTTDHCTHCQPGHTMRDGCALVGGEDGSGTADGGVPA